ncbi:MAG: hypothetical protein M1840_004048 [Geoglossum simile]|nr:MAG: hypothetical protein M1840_004048 [Geoglossum simile]
MLHARRGLRPPPDTSVNGYTRQLPASAFKLLHLPRKVVILIFCYVMSYPVSINYFKHSITYSKFHGPPNLALLRVCHCVRDAALVAFSRVNTFILNTTHGIPELWLRHEFLERLTTAEFVIPVCNGHANHEVEVLDLLNYVRIFVCERTRMRFVIESRDGSVMSITDPIMKILAYLQRRTSYGWRRPVVTFEKHLELGWMVKKEATEAE